MENRKKVYVEVRAIHLTDGTCRPESIKFENDEVFEIDRVKYCCRAASTKVGGTGPVCLLYTSCSRRNKPCIYSQNKAVV